MASETLESTSTNAAQLSSRLYRLSAILYAASIAGHTKHGFDKVYPALATIPTRPEYVVGKSAASNGWDYINASLLVAALLNWQWGRRSRVPQLEEKIIIYTLSAAGMLWSYRFIQVKTYAPLIPLLLAPSCSLAALALKGE